MDRGDLESGWDRQEMREASESLGKKKAHPTHESRERLSANGLQTGHRSSSVVVGISLASN